MSCTATVDISAQNRIIPTTSILVLPCQDGLFYWLSYHRAAEHTTGYLYILCFAAILEVMSIVIDDTTSICAIC